MRRSLLEVNSLNVNIGMFSLENIKFSMEPDDYVIILGPTGCGKTVTLEVIAGLRTPNSGTILLNDREITHMPPECRSIGFAYQDSLLYPFLSVKDNILFGARARSMASAPEIKRRLEHLAEAMNIAHLLERYPRFLSGGEKQRVSLARAILTRPPLLLLDEPLSSLDQQTRFNMQELLREIHCSEGIGIIHVTHDFSEAMQLGNRVIVMRDGRVEQVGRPQDIFYHPATEFTAKFLRGENLVQGRVLRQEGKIWFAYNGGDTVLGPLPERCQHEKFNALDKDRILFIRSGSIRLARDCDGPAPSNCWTAVFKNAVINTTHVDVFCNGNGYWQASMSLTEWRALALSGGERVRLSVVPEHLHLIPH